MPSSPLSLSPLHPLRFEPIYQYRLWGGRRLAHLLSAPLPDDESVGEAWLLSDRDDHASLVADGPFKGRTLRQMLAQRPKEMLGDLEGRFERFPLLLKFLDAHDALSVQVHPSDAQKDCLPKGESGKTEAWVVIEAGPQGRVYAGLKPGTTPETLRSAIGDGSVQETLASFTPNPGDGIFIPAGTVHSLVDLVVFEAQENSDVTFRLFDWNHVDAKTAVPRPLQVEQAMACIDFTRGAVAPVAPLVEGTVPVCRERLFDCRHFGVWRISGEMPFSVGAVGKPRVLVAISGAGHLVHEGIGYAFRKGDVLLLPAVAGICVCRPEGPLNVLEISLPEAALT